MGKRSVITSEEILEQAYQLACEQGLRSLSIRSIAAACDVSVGTVYNSYASKTELINDVVGMFWQRAFAETMKTLAAHQRGATNRAANDVTRAGGSDNAASESSDFIAFCEALSQSLKSALKEFRKEFLSDLSALSEGDRLSAQKREQQSFIHARAGIKQALLSDPKIKQDQLTGALAPDALAALVWETLIDSARDDMGYDKTLFELLRAALY